MFEQSNDLPNLPTRQLVESVDHLKPISQAEKSSSFFSYVMSR